MTEPTVQVPVSLIERIAAEYEREGWPLAAQKWRALLGEPTPSACICGPQSIVSDGPSTDCPIHGELAAPPSITNIVPGTTFHGRIEADGRIQGDHEDRWTVRPDRGAECERHGAVFELYEFDPSTIRDVTPPESPNAN